MKNHRFNHSVCTPLLLAVVTLPMALAGCFGTHQVNPRSCLKERGCPTAATLPRCTSAVTRVARPLGEVLASADQLAGRTVTVRSRLRRAGYSCTRLGCRSKCCNRCSSSLVLTTASRPALGTPHTVPLRNSASGRPAHPKLSCAGDESRVCCPYPKNIPVVVTGRLTASSRSQHGPTYALIDPRICQP